MTIQEKYWLDLIQAKFSSYYADERLNESYKINNFINIFTAITSSTSIAGWVIWNELGFIWAVAIAITQVINAIKPFLPYNKRTEYLLPLSTRFREIFNRYDYNWLNVSNGSMTESEINNLIQELRKEMLDSEQEFVGKNIIPDSTSAKAKADQKVEEYFKRYSPIGG